MVAVLVDMSTPVFPMGRNPKTGGKRYSDTQLSRLKPKWRAQWENYSELDEDMIDICVNEIHCGPFSWPGSRIAEGANKRHVEWMTNLARDWDRVGAQYTGRQLSREAKKLVNAQARKNAKAHGLEDDPFGFEYFLVEAARKQRRSESSRHF